MFKLAEDYAELMSRSTEAAKVYHYGVLLTILGARIGRRLWIAYSRKVYPNLYTCLVGPSGLARKTTAIRLGLPLLGDSAVLTGLSSMEGLLLHLSKRPNLVVVLEELATLWTKAKKQEYSMALIPKLAELYDCPERADLPTRKEPIAVDKPFLSILAATTPEWLEQSMDMTDIMGGAANRFMYLIGGLQHPLSMPQISDTKEIAREVESKLGRWKDETGVRFDADSQDLWERYYEKWYAEQTSDDEMLRTLSIRLPEQALKVALCIHAIEGKGDRLSWETLEMAVKFIESARAAVIALRPLFGSLEIRVLKMIEQSRGGITRSALHRKVGGRIRGRDLAESVATLFKFGRIVETNGRLVVKN